MASGRSSVPIGRKLAESTAGSAPPYSTSGCSTAGRVYQGRLFAAMDDWLSERDDALRFLDVANFLLFTHLMLQQQSHLYNGG